MLRFWVPRVVPARGPVCPSHSSCGLGTCEPSPAHGPARYGLSEGLVCCWSPHTSDIPATATAAATATATATATGTATATATATGNCNFDQNCDCNCRSPRPAEALWVELVRARTVWACEGARTVAAGAPGSCPGWPWQRQVGAAALVVVSSFQGQPCSSQSLLRESPGDIPGGAKERRTFRHRQEGVSGFKGGKRGKEGKAAKGRVRGAEGTREH